MFPPSPCLAHSRLGEREDLVEDFSEREEEFLELAPVTEWVESPEIVIIKVLVININILAII